MTRKIISAFLVLLLCVSLTVSVCAVPAEVSFVVDELGCLTDDERSGLNDLAVSIYTQTGVGVFFVYAQTESVEDYDVGTVVGDITDYVLMLENETHWYIHLGGEGQIIDLDAEELLRAAYDAPPTYYEGVAAYLEATAEYFPQIPDAAETYIPEGTEYFLYDEADLLTKEEEEDLVHSLEQISHTYKAQLVVATIASMDGGDVDTYVDYLYDSMGFGYGQDHDGVLLLICMDPREYRILSNGYAGVAIGPDEIDTLCDFMDTYLPNGYYTTAFHAFADQCGEFLDGYLNGYPFKFGKNLAISLIIGLIAGLIVAFVLKGQLKSVRKQNQASAYVKKDSLHIAVKQDIFLYRNVTRSRKEKSSSSGSGATARSKGGGSF